MGNFKKHSKEYFQNLRKESAKAYAEVPALNWGTLDPNGKYVMNDRYDFKWKYPTGPTKSLTLLPMDLKSYIKDFQEKSMLEGRDVKAWIGTDSQNNLSYTRFVTVICLVVERNGVHVLVSRMDVPKIYDYHYRLLKETDISAEFARKNKDFFKEINMKVEVHGDYNAMTNHKSNGVVTEATNYLKAHGFNLVIKAQAYGASYAADYWC